MQIYIISLESSVDRQKSIKSQCKKFNITPVFVEAINGSNLSTSEINKYCSQEKAKQLFGRELLLGEIGCALSHKKIYNRVVDENIPHAIIFEDDVIIEKGFNEVVKSILHSDLNWELALLGHHKDISKRFSTPLSIWYRYDLTTESSLNRLADFGFGTYGYMITVEGAKKLIAALDVIYKPIDHYTSDSNIINVYALSPTVVNVNSNFDTLIDDNKVRKNTSDRFLVFILKKIGIIHTMVRIKSLLKSLKPIKKYK